MSKYQDKMLRTSIGFGRVSFGCSYRYVSCTDKSHSHRLFAGFRYLMLLHREKGVRDCLIDECGWRLWCSSAPVALGEVSAHMNRICWSWIHIPRPGQVVGCMYQCF